MRKILLLLALIVLPVTSMAQADGWEANLNAGNDSVVGGLHYKRYLNTGYMKTGISGLYTEDDDMEYKWGELKLVVGNENIRPGLTCEVGLKGIFGNAEENIFSGDVGALAFTGYIGYLFSEQLIPIPLEVFGEISYAPEILSFLDTEDFLSYYFGIGVRVIENASVLFGYSAVDMDMEAAPRPWQLDDGMIRLGLMMRF